MCLYFFDREIYFQVKFMIGKCVDKDLKKKCFPAELLDKKSGPNSIKWKGKVIKGVGKRSFEKTEMFKLLNGIIFISHDKYIK